MNTLGTICGWIIFKMMSKIFRNLSSKTVVKESNDYSMLIKLEQYIYYYSTYQYFL